MTQWNGWYPGGKGRGDKGIGKGAANCVAYAWQPFGDKPHSLTAMQDYPHYPTIPCVAMQSTEKRPNEPLSVRKIHEKYRVTSRSANTKTFEHVNSFNVLMDLTEHTIDV